jgi:hypothetical protein
MKYFGETKNLITRYRNDDIAGSCILLKKLSSQFMAEAPFNEQTSHKIFSLHR